MPRPSYGCWLYVRGCCSHGGVHTAHSSPPSVTVELPGTALGGLVGVQVCSPASPVVVGLTVAVGLLPKKATPPPQPPTMMVPLMLECISQW